MQNDLTKHRGRPNLTREVVNAMAQLVMERVWSPGDPIPSEKELAARFGVGRSTIREAVQSLVTLGVVEVRHGEGSFVREPTSELLSSAFLWGLLLSPRTIGDFTEFRICIEATCAGIAADKRSDDLSQTLYEVLALMKSSPQNEVVCHDNRFHILIAEALAIRSSSKWCRHFNQPCACGFRSPIPLQVRPTTRWPNIALSPTLFVTGVPRQRARRCGSI